MKLLSIVVPIYNIQDYIKQCVESILSQTFQNFELLLVDDGSTDESGAIIDQYAIHPVVSVFHKENGGLSDARNFGINHAKGKYVMFVDGDDFLYSKYCLQKIADVLEEKKCDILQYKMVYYYPYKNKCVFFDPLETTGKDIYGCLTDLNRKGRVSVSACEKIIRLELLRKNDLLFEKGLLNEDIKWSYQLYLKAKTFVTLDENIYVYRQQRRNSISTVKGMKNAADLYSIIKYWYDYSYPDEKTKELYYHLISYWYVILRTNYKRSYFSPEMRESFQSMDRILLSYDDNYKVKMTHRVAKVFGYRISFLILKLYIFLKNKGLIKL